MATRFITPEPSFMMHLQLLIFKQPVFLFKFEGGGLDMEGDDEMAPKQMDKVKRTIWNLILTMLEV